MVTISTMVSSSLVPIRRFVQRARAKFSNNGQSKRTSRLKMRKLRDFIRRVMGLKKKYNGNSLRTGTASPPPHSSPSPFPDYAKLLAAPKIRCVELDEAELSSSFTNVASGNQLGSSEVNETESSIDDSASIYARESFSPVSILSELAFDTPLPRPLSCGPVSLLFSPLLFPRHFPPSVSPQSSNSAFVCTEYFPPHRLPTEVFLLILEYLDQDAFIFKRLLSVRGVCRLWRSAAINLAKCRSLITTPGFFALREDNDRTGEMRQWVNNSIAASYPVFDMLSFSLCTKFYSPETRLDIDLVKSFTAALKRCKRAVLTVDLTHVTPDLSDDMWKAVPGPFPCSYLRELSWTSSHIGIDDHLPWYYEFPGSTLATGLPWGQLTNLSLNCPLSTNDAFRILYLSRSAIQSVSLDLQPKHDPTSDSKVLKKPDLSLENLRSLSISSSVNLLTLFSKLDLPTLRSLNLHAYSDSLLMGQVVTVLDYRLNIPWASLQDLSLQNDTFIIDDCDLGSILSKCEDLQSLSLSCHNQGRFAATPIPELYNLKDVTLDMDEPCDALLDALKNQPIAKLELSTPPRNTSSLGHFEDTLNHLFVKKQIGSQALCEILRNQIALISAEFHVDDKAWEPQGEKIDCRRLTLLKIYSNVRLQPFWEVLQAGAILKIQLRFEGLHDAFCLTEIEPFLNRSNRSIASYAQDTYSCDIQFMLME